MQWAAICSDTAEKRLGPVHTNLTAPVCTQKR